MLVNSSVTEQFELPPVDESIKQYITIGCIDNGTIAMLCISLAMLSVVIISRMFINYLILRGC